MDEQAINEFRKKKESAAAPVELAELKGIKILLAEDNEMNREISVDILEDAGFEVETASIRAGMNDHIAKPIKREELFDTIGKFAK